MRDGQQTPRMLNRVEGHTYGGEAEVDTAALDDTVVAVVGAQSLSSSPGLRRLAELLGERRVSLVLTPVRETCYPTTSGTCKALLRARAGGGTRTPKGVSPPGPKPPPGGAGQSGD